jgi:hypothetical protein
VDFFGELGFNCLFRFTFDGLGFFFGSGDFFFNNYLILLDYCMLLLKRI